MTKIELHKIIIVITCFVAVLCGCTGDEVTFSLFDTALKRDNYKAIFAYDDCTDVLYSIYLNTLDNKLINDFHKLISGDIDAETHWFIEDGAIYQMYYKRFLNYEDLSYINRHLYQLAYIAYETDMNGFRQRE